MEEILKELIQTTLEKGPQNKQFYSNLSITKPIHDHAEIQHRLGEAISFLQSSFNPGKGFQSKIYTSRNCAIKSDHVCRAFKLPEDRIEVLTSVLALDLLFNNIDNEQFVSPNFQEIICNISDEIQDELHNLIVPSSGISTFNLFKQLSQISPSSEPSPIQNLNHNISSGNDCFDSGNDSPTSMCSNSIDNAANIIDSFPDDINTSMITLYVLVHQGILQAKPVESVLRWITSNVFSFENEDFKPEIESSPKNHAKSTTSASSSVTTFPTFITRQGSSDPVGVANVLNLMYLLDISHEVLLNAAEELIVTTLKKTLIAVNAEEDINESAELSGPSSSSSSPEAGNELGNTQKVISLEDNGKRHCSSMNSEAPQEPMQSEFILQHHSPDSLLYFLSRAMAISLAPCNISSTNARRPYITQMKSLLLDLLDARLGTTMNTCDLAMRILAGVYLGVVNVSNNTTNLSSIHSTINRSNGHTIQQQSMPFCDTAKIIRINNLLQKEFELLVSLQNDADGSWQADSIVHVGFYEDGDNDCVVNSNGNENDYDSSHGIETMGYLGGKELATIFAVKAIAVFLSWKKGTFVGDTEERWGTADNANYVDEDADVHKLY